MLHVSRCDTLAPHFTCSSSLVLCHTHQTHHSLQRYLRRCHHRPYHPVSAQHTTIQADESLRHIRYSSRHVAVIADHRFFQLYLCHSHHRPQRPASAYHHPGRQVLATCLLFIWTWRPRVISASTRCTTFLRPPSPLPPPASTSCLTVSPPQAEEYLQHVHYLLFVIMLGGMILT